jgi:hypothetical protein
MRLVSKFGSLAIFSSIPSRLVERFGRAQSDSVVGGNRLLPSTPQRVDNFFRNLGDQTFTHILDELLVNPAGATRLWRQATDDTKKVD